MRNNDFLKNILKKIGAQIPCPKCRKIFSDGDLSLVSLEGNNIKLETCCSHCGAKINIGANIKSTENVDNSRVSVGNNFVKNNKKWLSPESVRGIAEKVRNFKGVDVRSIFV